MRENFDASPLATGYVTHRKLNSPSDWCEGEGPGPGVFSVRAAEQKPESGGPESVVINSSCKSVQTRVSFKNVNTGTDALEVRRWDLYVDRSIPGYCLVKGNSLKGQGRGWKYSTVWICIRPRQSLFASFVVACRGLFYPVRTKSW